MTVPNTLLAIRPAFLRGTTYFAEMNQHVDISALFISLPHFGHKSYKQACGRYKRGAVVIRPVVRNSLPRGDFGTGLVVV